MKTWTEVEQNIRQKEEKSFFIPSEEKFIFVCLLPRCVVSAARPARSGRTAAVCASPRKSEPC